MRAGAAYTLLYIGDSSAVPALIKAMKDEPYVRSTVAYCLGRFQDKRAVPSLIKAMKDDDEDVRRHAVCALGSIGDKSAIPVFIDTFFNDKNESVRGYSLMFLGQIGDESAVPTLMKILKIEKGKWRSSAISALVELEAKEVIPELIKDLKDENKNVRSRAAFNLCYEIIGKSALPALIKALEDKFPLVRNNAAEALIKIGDKSALPALIKALKDNNSRVRMYAAKALGNIGDRSAIKSLQVLFTKEEEYYSRISIAESLIKLDSPDKQDKMLLILNALVNGDKYLRRQAARVIGNIRDKTYVSRLLRALNDENRDIREEVAIALGKIGDKAAIKPLQKLFEKEDYIWIKILISEALIKLNAPYKKEKLDYIVKQLKCKFRNERMLAVLASGRILEKSVLPNLRYVAENDKDSSIRKKAKKVIAKLEKKYPELKQPQTKPQTQPKKK